MKVGLIGTGRMGQAIVLRLIEKGHSVGVWNRTFSKLEAPVSAGARRAETPARLAEESDALIVILTNAEAQKAVYSTPKSGLLAADLESKLVIDMSTVRPEASIALAALVSAKGAYLLRVRWVGPRALRERENCLHLLVQSLRPFYLLSLCS